ncbi:MAG: mechanosensitive ion channel family protein [Actinobacteria bacterium]|nr:mechanosensitive ion channel family protein [Actinomycetota bacterium]
MDAVSILAHQTPGDQLKDFWHAVRDSDWTAAGVAAAGEAAVVIGVLAATAVVALVGRRLVRRWVSRATARGLARSKDPGRHRRAELRATTLGSVLGDVLTAVVWAAGIMTAVGTVGISLGPLLAGAGIAGVAIGFGTQSLVKDFFSGFFILLEDQYGVGDVIQVDPDVAGLVEDISMRVTRLRSLDGTVWFVPNGEIRLLANRSKEWARALVDFQVAYGADLDNAMQAIEEVAARLRRDPEIGAKILEDAEILGVEMLGESGVTIRTFIKTLPLEQWTVSRRFRRDVKGEFDARGVEIPVPHRKVIIQDGGSPAR